MISISTIYAHKRVLRIFIESIVEMASSTRDTCSIDTQVIQLYDQRANTKVKLAGDVLQKVQWIRNRCFEAEHQEHGGAQNFRRGNGGGPRNSGNHGPSQAHSQSHSQAHSQSLPVSNNSTPNNPVSSFRSGVTSSEKHVVPTKNTGGNAFSKDTKPAWGGHGGNHSRYVSIFKKSENVNGQILNNLILSKLNKFSKNNYDDIKTFIQQILDSDDKEFVKAFVNLVFNKASQEPAFCALFAKLLGDLTNTYASVQEEVMVLYESYMGIFDEVEERPDTTNMDQQTKNNQLIQQTRDKTYRLGYSQFLSELTCLQVITIENLMKLFQKILDNIQKYGKEEEHMNLVDVYTECFLCMGKAFKKKAHDTLAEKRVSLRNHYSKILSELINNCGEGKKYSGIGSRSMFALMDTLDILEERGA